MAIHRGKTRSERGAGGPFWGLLVFFLVLHAAAMALPGGGGDGGIWPSKRLLGRGSAGQLVEYGEDGGVTAVNPQDAVNVQYGMAGTVIETQAVSNSSALNPIPQAVDALTEETAPPIILRETEGVERYMIFTENGPDSSTETSFSTLIPIQESEDMTLVDSWRVFLGPAVDFDAIFVHADGALISSGLKHDFSISFALSFFGDNFSDMNDAVVSFTAYRFISGGVEQAAQIDFSTVFDEVQQQDMLKIEVKEFPSNL